MSYDDDDDDDNRHGSKSKLLCPFRKGGTGSPSNNVLIHPAVWPQQTCADLTVQRVIRLTT